MNIYKILESKQHNKHYLNRYVKFISNYFHQQKQKGITERHHICPKANDLFPEYSCFKQNPWNSIHLTKRQHFIAHYLLSKCYTEIQSQQYAFLAMCNKQSKKDHTIRDYRVISRTYENCKNRIDYSKRKPPKQRKPFDQNLQCFDQNGNLTQIPSSKYNKNIHTHSNKNYINIRNESGEIIRVSRKEFEEKKLKGMQNGTTCVINSITGEKLRISVEEYNNCPFYVSVAPIIYTIKNIITNERKSVSKEEYMNYDKTIWVDNNSRGWYHTPIGKFSSPTDPKLTILGNHNSIANWCINNNKTLKPASVKRIKWATKEHVNKTFKELGFWYEPF